MVYIKLLRFLCGRVDFSMHSIGIFALLYDMGKHKKSAKFWGKNKIWEKKENKYTYPDDGRLISQKITPTMSTLNTNVFT